MRLPLIATASLAALLLAACAPAAEQPAVEPPAEPTAEMSHEDHGDMHGEAPADETVDRGEISGPVVFLEGTILPPPAGRDIAAGFGTFAAGSQAVTITGGQAAFAQAVELHTHEMSADGKMAMRQVESFAVPANGDHALARGGDHIMFFGVAPDSLTPGASVTVTFDIQLEDGTTQTVDAPLTVASAE